MNSQLLINYLIRQRGYKRYLEITAHPSPHHLSRIATPHKDSITPAKAEQFFANHHEPYQLIFIDGIHTESAVLDDIARSLALLSPGGAIILHDCMPPDAWHQRGIEAYREGENWNGTVWKAALRTFNESAYACELLDMDWGCGIIDTSRTQTPKRQSLPEELDYAAHYRLLLAYRISYSDWLRRHVTVFYHLACMGNWEQVFSEQMQQLSSNGFTNIRLSILGSAEDVRTALATAGSAHLHAHLFFQSGDLTCFERPALEGIEAYAQHNGGYILYLHSKGVSNPADHTKTKWRRLMMRELVDKWETCVRQLPDYDAVGVNWREMPPISHFCGNFWYASVPYLRRLAAFQSYYDNPRYKIWDRINDKRLGCEFWIGSAPQRPRVLSLFCRNVDFCNPDYWKNIHT